MTNTIDITTEQSTAVSQTKKNTPTSKAEICFGALMGIAAVAGMWGMVSFLISYFLGG